VGVSSGHGVVGYICVADRTRVGRGEWWNVYGGD
jgi:hypothetical protein